MSSCPIDSAALSPQGAGEGCPRCGGLWIDASGLDGLGPGAANDLLAPETRTDAPPYRTTWHCPDCEAVLAPWRLGGMEAWALRCPSCERLWLGKLEQRTLKLLTRRTAVERAVQSFSPDERREMASDLAQASLGAGYALSPVHQWMARLGLPVVLRTQGTRSPLVTWLLALALTALYVLGGPDAPARYGFHPAAPTLAQAVSANFVHFGVLHLVGNLYFLLAFGDGVEQRIPGWGLLALFVAAGTAALAFDGLIHPDATVIAGASGGIAALMGACIVVQPQAKVAVSFFALEGSVARWPIWAWGALELVFQALMALFGIPGTAWMAHVAGMGLGAVAGLVIRAWPRPSGQSPLLPTK